jgi:hypothetical protein
MKVTVQQAVIAYSCVVSTALAVVLLAGAKAPGKQTFDEIQVHRIDVVEPDGTLRMVISNHARLPAVMVKGAELGPAGRPQAGMLFYNDEGTENGGLIFGGHKNEKGEVVDCCGSLSFDRYDGKQIVQFAGVDDATDRFAGLAVNDQSRRVWVGRDADGATSMSLMDTAGKKRIVMKVAADGTPSLIFLDNKGSVVQQLVPATGH